MIAFLLHLHWFHFMPSPGYRYVPYIYIIYLQNVYCYFPKPYKINCKTLFCYEIMLKVGTRKH